MHPTISFPLTPSNSSFRESSAANAAPENSKLGLNGSWAIFVLGACRSPLSDTCIKEGCETDCIGLHVACFRPRHSLLYHSRPVTLLFNQCHIHFQNRLAPKLTTRTRPPPRVHPILYFRQTPRHVTIIGGSRLWEWSVNQRFRRCPCTSYHIHTDLS